MKQIGFSRGRTLMSDELEARDLTSSLSVGPGRRDYLPNRLFILRTPLANEATRLARAHSCGMKFRQTNSPPEAAAKASFSSSTAYRLEKDLRLP
ncbi:hypothetical protein, partial [Bradyrhizobium sp. 144]|uniref:hypothetical protein n=1 Tax=Bradyrhizobium sp. 144 TaxID=2782620 RepID=UPI001FF88A31